jgi:hypothetical protein
MVEMGLLLATNGNKSGILQVRPFYELPLANRLHPIKPINIFFGA